MLGELRVVGVRIVRVLFTSSRSSWRRSRWESHASPEEVGELDVELISAWELHEYAATAEH